MEHELIYDLMRRRGDRDYPMVFNRHLQGLRCCILRHLMGLDFREFAFRLADSVLLQWFTLSAPYGIVNPPAKSTLERYNKNFSKELIKSLIYELTLKAASPDTGGRPGEPDPALDLDAVFADCTCVQANIHHPVDWVLLRDGVRTLMGAIKLIRREGLCHRMEKPEAFLCRINELCMEMSVVRRKSDSKNQEAWFGKRQKRRAGIEARVGIFRNVFLGNPLRQKKFKNREKAVTWCVLAHNLWVLARKSLADEANREQAAAA